MDPQRATLLTMIQAAEDKLDPTGTFEVIKILGRELQFSKEKIRHLEGIVADSGTPISSNKLNSAASKELVRKAEEAECQVIQLKEELENALAYNAKVTSKVERLQNRVDKLKSMKQEQNDANDATVMEEGKRTTSRVQELEAKLRKADEDKAYLEKKISGLEEENAGLRGLAKKADPATNVWTIENYIQFSRDLPRHRVRPDYISLLPICDASTDLRTYLEADKDLKWPAQNILCLPSPGRLLWASTSCQIGFAFGPIFQYHGPGPGWVQQSDYSGRYGKELEVFFKNGGHIYYAGRYLFQDIRAENPQGCYRVDPESANALADVTLPPRIGGSETIRDALWMMVKKLYMDGILRAECAVLRCVGFNHRVHDDLSARYEILQTLEARRVSERESFNSPRPRKKGRQS